MFVSRGCAAADDRPLTCSCRGMIVRILNSVHSGYLKLNFHLEVVGDGRRGGSGRGKGDRQRTQIELSW